MLSLHRIRRHRRPESLNFLDTSSTDAMSVASSERTSSLRTRNRNTGFPESFCGNRNTSLPHPDADLSPNACITQEDISVSRVLSRQRHSFHNKYKRTIAHGHITPEMEQMYSEVAVISDSEASPVDGRVPNVPGASTVGHQIGTGRPSSGAGASFGSTSTGDHDDAAPKPGRFIRHSRVLSSDSGASSQGRRRSFLQRFGIYRHHD